MATLTKSNATKVRKSRAKKTPVVDRIEAAIQLVEANVPDPTPVVPTTPPVSAVQAANRVAEFKLTPDAKALLRKAVDACAKNDGARIADDQGGARLREQANLLTICRGDLGLAVSCLQESASEPGTIYSLLYAVMKNALYIGNLDYRRLLDPKQDEDLPERSDIREDHRTSPYGMQPDVVDPDALPDYQRVVVALGDINLYLDLLSKAFGSPLDQFMPITVVMHPSGSFSPVHGVEHALDIVEVNRQRARAKRDIKRTADLASAAAIAKRALLNAASALN